MAISGSLRPGSSNTSILHLLSSLSPSHVKLEIYEGLGDLPHFNPSMDLEPPTPVLELRRRILEADGVLICTPEYAHGVPGVLKNALDWTVSSSEFTDKPVALITASTDGQQAHLSLLDTLGVIGAKIPEGAALLISYIKARMNDKGEVSDPATLQALRSVLDSLIAAIGKEQ